MGGHSPSPGHVCGHVFLHNGLYDWWYLRVKQKRAYAFGTAAALGLAFVLFTLSFLTRYSNICPGRRKCSCDLIVPDVLHFYRGDREAENMTKKEGACLRAALRLHGEVWLHTTYPLKSIQALESVGLDSKSVKVTYPPRGPGPVHLAILREYGGIFLKNDIYLVERLDRMRGHELASAGEEDIVAGTKEGALSGFQVRLRGVLLDKDYGALYISEVLRNCTYSAVRLGVR